MRNGCTTPHLARRSTLTRRPKNSRRLSRVSSPDPGPIRTSILAPSPTLRTCPIQRRRSTANDLLEVLPRSGPSPRELHGATWHGRQRREDPQTIGRSGQWVVDELTHTPLTGTPLTALVLNCTLTPSPAESSSALMASQFAERLAEHRVGTFEVRVVDHDVRPGVEDDMGGDDEWQSIRERVLGSDILVFVTRCGWALEHRPTRHGTA